jgi:GNAT superfamily N-acetyltransferase
MLDRSTAVRLPWSLAMTATHHLDSVLRDATGDLVLRRAAEDDSEFAFAMRKAAFRVYVDKSGGWDERKERQRHERNFVLYDYRIISLQAVDRGIMTLDLADDCLKLNQIFIAPEHQGQGIGERCMSVLFGEARHLGLPIQLRVMKMNPRAGALYERLDFAVFDETETHTIMQWHP